MPLERLSFSADISTNTKLPEQTRRGMLPKAVYAR